MQEILIVDDKDDIRSLLYDIATDEGYYCVTASNAQEAMHKFKESDLSVAIVDIWLGEDGEGGTKLLQEFKKQKPWLPVIMISGHGNIEIAVNTIKSGAYDFIEKPFQTQRLLLTLQRAAEKAELMRRNIDPTKYNKELQGNSKIMQSLKKEAIKIAQGNSRVLITGEPGTGKEVLARMIHKHSGRASKRFVTLHAANISEDNLEYELFGDYQSNRQGILEMANTGTLFIDEISQMDIAAQTKFLKFLQEKVFYRKGSTRAIEADIRIIATSSKDLKKEVEYGKLNQSLYYRLNVIPLFVPSIRQRPEDIRCIAKYFFDEFAKKFGIKNIQISEEVFSIFEAYDWRGNTREIKNIIERIIVTRDGDNCIDKKNIPSEIYKEISASAPEMINVHLMSKPIKTAREIFDKKYIEYQLNRFKGNVAKTSQFIGIDRASLHRKIKSLEINAPDNCAFLKEDKAS